MFLNTLIPKKYFAYTNVIENVFHIDFDALKLWFRLNMA
jgi:hypothetical protein